MGRAVLRDPRVQQVQQEVEVAQQVLQVQRAHQVQQLFQMV